MEDKPEIKTKYSTQEILNQSFDETLRSLVFQEIGTPAAEKITVSGDIVYLALAPTGSAQSAAVWQAQKIDTASITTTWADSGRFSQVATDLTALTYA